LPYKGFKTICIMSPTMNPLEPPDSRHLDAAQGWLPLGDPIEANVRGLE